MSDDTNASLFLMWNKTDRCFVRMKYPLRIDLSYPSTYKSNIKRRFKKIRTQQYGLPIELHGTLTVIFLNHITLVT